MLMPGQTYGRLTVVEAVEGKRSASQRVYKVRCNNCQTVFEAKGYEIKTERAGACRCKKRQPRDLVGQRFGMLVVKVLSDQKARRNGTCWVCVCDCGATCVRSHETLLKGQRCSCGCRKPGPNRPLGFEPVDKTPEYRIWASMIQRCSNPAATKYEQYGGRNITVDKAWLLFDAFIGDMGKRPSAKHSIDRIDNALGYGPDNCRWATPREQQNNRRITRTVTYQGRTQSLADWADETGIPYARLNLRLRRGYRPEQILNPTHPLPRGGNH